MIASARGAPRVRRRLRPADLVGTATVGLRTRRGRTALTALGIAIGIAAMFGVLGISASSRADLIARLDRLGTNLLVVTPGQSFLGSDAKLPTAAPAMIRRIGPVQQAAATATVNASVLRNHYVPSTETGGISVEAAEPSLARTLKARLHDGVFLDAATARYPAVVLGAVAAQRLGIVSVASAPAVWLGGRPYTVIGILDPIALSPDTDSDAIIGFPIAEHDFGIDGTASTVFVRTSPASVDAVRNVLPATANPESPNEVQVDRPTDALAARAATDSTFTALLLGLGGVALLVGGVGIANVMVISVLERRTEIGVRRALGATRRHIAGQFVVESALLASAGGVLGVVLGALITAGYANARGWKLALPATGLAGGIAAALVIGALAGLYPAGRAARLAPAEAVRPL